jgi:uncharacterized protein YbaR (Trm112 family)
LKRGLLDIICCPACKGDLALSVKKEDASGIIEGALSCARCGRSFPVEDGIPDLVIG